MCMGDYPTGKPSGGGGARMGAPFDPATLGPGFWDDPVLRPGNRGRPSAAAGVTAPPLPSMPSSPPAPQAMPPLPAQQPIVSTTAIAGPRAASSAPTAKQDGGSRGQRRRNSRGTASLSIGSTQSAAGAGLNIGR